MSIHSGKKITRGKVRGKSQAKTKEEKKDKASHSQVKDTMEKNHHGLKRERE